MGVLHFARLTPAKFPWHVIAMPGDNRFNTVVIVDSIPDGELNTARRLREDLRDVAFEFSPTPRIEYYRAESHEELVRVFAEIQLCVSRDGIQPLVHIEAHGYKDGLELARGELVSWEQAKTLFIPLNIAMRLNLMVVLAACHGGTFLKALRLADRAPFWGLIGPTDALSVAQIQLRFDNFYKTMFRTLLPTQAIEALNANAP